VYVFSRCSENLYILLGTLRRSDVGDTVLCINRLRSCRLRLGHHGGEIWSSNYFIFSTKHAVSWQYNHLGTSTVHFFYTWSDGFKLIDTLVYVDINFIATVRSKAWVCNRSLAGIVSSNPAEAWMSVSCECCVLSGNGLFVGLITRPEEPYQVWCV
jgi:hypothetical protein